MAPADPTADPPLPPPAPLHTLTTMRTAQTAIPIARAPVEQILPRVIATLKRKGPDALAAVLRGFRTMDEDASGMVSFAEFGRTLKGCGISLGEDEVEALYLLNARDTSYEMPYTPFIQTLTTAPSDARKQLIRQAYRPLDLTSNGVSLDDLRQMYNSREHPDVTSGKRTQAEVTQTFLDNFDTRRTEGKVPLDEFERYYSLVSTCVEDDAHFQLLIWNTWLPQPRLRSRRGARPPQ